MCTNRNKRLIYRSAHCNRMIRYITAYTPSQYVHIADKFIYSYDSAHRTAYIDILRKYSAMRWLNGRIM